MIYDIILFAILVLFVAFGVKKGAAAALVGMAAAFISYTAATFIGKWLSSLIYQAAIKSTIQDTVTSEVSTFGNSTISESAGQTAESVAQPIVSGILSFFLTIILFLIIYFLLRKLVMPLVLKAFEIPVIKQVNALLGGVIGAVEALLLVCMLAYLLRLIIPQISTDIPFLNEETIYSSYIFKHLYDGNIFSMFASWLTL